MNSETKRVKVKDVKRVLAPSFMEVYANHIDGSPAFHDLRLVFGSFVVSFREGESTPSIEERVAVALGWEAAKMLRDMLIKAVEQFEGEYGPLRVNAPQQEITSE